MKIFLATKNKGKITEFQQMLSKMDVELVTCQDIDIPDVEETGSTFVENAILKARSAANFTSLPSIADDSGIEVYHLILVQLKLCFYQARKKLDHIQNH